MAAPALAEAVATAAQEAEFAGLSENERVRTLIMLARDGRHELAGSLLAQHPLTGPFAHNRTLFIEGLILKAEGHLPAAVEKYRAALADDSSLTMVRAELAHTLYLLGEDDSAKHHLELLKGVAPTAEQARDITQFIEAIDARRPVKVSAYVGIAPSSNINNGSSNNKVIVGGVPLEIDNEEKSGIGIAAGINAAYTRELDDQLSAVIGFGAHTLQYEGNEYDQLSVSETAEIRYKTQAGYVGLGALSSQSLNGGLANVSEWVDFSGDISAWTLGPRFTLFHGIAPDLAFNGSATVLRQEYADVEVAGCVPAPGEDCMTDSYYNGWLGTIEGKLSKVFAADLTGYVSGGVARDITDGRDDLDYWSVFGTLGIYKEFPWGVTATTEIEALRQVYDADFNPVYPELAVPRRDTQLGTTVALWKRDFSILGYSPVIEYNFTWNSSNIDFFDYTSHTVDFRLTKEF